MVIMSYKFIVVHFKEVNPENRMNKKWIIPNECVSLQQY